METDNCKANCSEMWPPPGFVDNETEVRCSLWCNSGELEVKMFFLQRKNGPKISILYSYVASQWPLFSLHNYKELAIIPEDKI